MSLDHPRPVAARSGGAWVGSLRLPWPEYYRAVEHATATGQSVSDVIRAALTAHLDNKAPR